MLHMSIRLAKPEDAQRLAEIHIRAWHETYRGIMPDKLLAELSVTRSADGWAKRLGTPPERQAVWVACDDLGTVVGFVTAGPTRLPELTTDGEVLAINLVNEAKRMGHGVRLMHAAAEHLIACGFTSVGLWVLEQNVGARAIYERLGGITAMRREEDFGGTFLTELGIVWSAATDLEQRARQLFDDRQRD
jgi:ribosomal protein S18 acetylase RimI-like enzyme